MDEDEFYRHASLRVCGHLDIAEAMRSTLEYFQGIIPADRLYLQLYEPDLGSMRTIATSSRSTPAEAVDGSGDGPSSPRAAVARRLWRLLATSVSTWCCST